MSYKHILITGSTGKLGRVISALESNLKLMTPKRAQLDIADISSVKNYFENNKVDAVIHCAAMTDMRECEKSPNAALTTNTLGTLNLVNEVLRKKSSTRFVYISTDYVYPCTTGNYKESDAVSPYNVYAWSKFTGELAVKILPNYSIIRTSFFDPDNVTFDTAPTDAFCSKIPVQELARGILGLLESEFIGVINVGQERISFYDLYRKYNPVILPTTLEEISKNLPIKRAKDSSLDVTLWKKISAEIEDI